MKKFLTITALALCSMGAFAQSDPVIMLINGKPILRSEFEYSFNKNNSSNVIDKKSIDEYVELFINYKLKVEAAIEEGLDTTAGFKKEFAEYRDQQVNPMLVTSEEVEREAYRLYSDAQRKVDSNGGMARVSHILFAVKQQATDSEMKAMKQKADSVYEVLKAAEFSDITFAQLAKAHSDDKGSARQGGQLPWITKGQTLPEFENKVWSMAEGETCGPLKTTAGYHLIKLQERGQYLPYDSLRANIISFIDKRGLKNQILNQKLDSIAAREGSTREQVREQKRAELTETDLDLKYLIQEYHDGLLLYEVMNSEVWERAAADEEALAKYYKKNKKKYAWDEPRFKGIAYWTREAADVANVKAAVKNVKYNDWNSVLRKAFNNDSVLKIRAEKGIFKKGDNGLVDQMEFGLKSAKVKEIKEYPNTGTYGKMIKKPESYEDVKALVIADYQEELEKIWIADLRKKYTVAVDEDILKTVNNHE